jgi:lysophospholipase L1-like esterase
MTINNEQERTMTSAWRALIFGMGLFAASPVLAQATQPSPGIKPIEPSKIILVGDSTTAVFGGWGPSFCGYHVTSFMTCVNLARGGRSSGSYFTEGSWQIALQEMQTKGYKNVWVTIQFGHNDQPGKPGRSTDLKTEFPANLKRYVEAARAAGAKPILVTPLTRRMFGADGKLQRDLDPWADAVRKIAAELHLPLIDLNADSARVVQAMGPAVSDMLAETPPGVSTTDAPKTAASPYATEVNDQPMAHVRLGFDHTHLGRAGADLFATMVTGELSKAVPDMRPLLVP